MDTAWEDVCIEALDGEEWKEWTARHSSHVFMAPLIHIYRNSVTVSLCPSRKCHRSSSVTVCIGLMYPAAKTANINWTTDLGVLRANRAMHTVVSLLEAQN